MGKHHPEVPSTKAVSHLGQDFTAPAWVKFVAADSDGKVYGHSQRPRSYMFPLTGRVTHLSSGGQTVTIGQMCSHPVVGVE